MNIPLAIPLYSVKENTTCYLDFSDRPVIAHFKAFPICTIDRDSYVVDSMIYSNLPYALHEGYACVNLHIGRFCSIADHVSFHMGDGHDYKRIAMGATKLLENAPHGSGKRQKGSIIIQNDVWIGTGATIMPGVVVHNGAVIAAGSHVTKDVPPYAIVGGNPAKVIGWRFEQDVIDRLQAIQWWYWDEEKIRENAEYFSDNTELFCNRFYPEALKDREAEREIPSGKEVQRRGEGEEENYLLIPDLGCSYEVYLRVIKEFIDKFFHITGKNLLIFLTKEHLEQYASQCGELMKLVDLCRREGGRIQLAMEGEHTLYEVFRETSDFIITRHPDTVKYSCLADYFRLRFISGADEPIW